jgi:flagellar basal body P-ring formation protein FlgA
MTRAPRHLPVILGLICLWPATAQAGITGPEVVTLIRQAMAREGLPPPAMTAPLRALPACDHPPEVTPQGGGWATVALRCTAPHPWTRVLRTGSKAIAPRPDTPDQTTPDASAPLALTLRRALPRGARVARDDLILRPLTGIDPAQRLGDPALAAGRTLRRALGAGQPLLERHLDPALDIAPGQSVTLHLQHGAIEIAAPGTALAGGVAGSRIPVQPASGGDPVEAQIIAPGLVRVRPNMPRRSAVKQGKRRLSWSE